MTLFISRADLDGNDPTLANLVFSDNTVNGGGYELQIAVRPDFQFCVCPIIYIAGNVGNYLLKGLNQDATYYARIRNRGPDGRIYDWSPLFTWRSGHKADRATAPAPIMIEPAIFVVPETIVGATANIPVKAGFPLTNLFRDSPVATRLEMPVSQPAAFFLDTSGAPIDVIAMLQTNIPEAATLQIFAYADRADYNANGIIAARQVYFGQARASDNLPGRPGYHTLVRLPAPVTGKKLWVLHYVGGIGDVTGATVEATYAVLGLNRVSKNHALEKTETPAPLTTSERRRSGMVDRVKGLPMRKVDFELQMLTEAQYETIYGDLWRYEGEPVLVVPNSKSGAFFHDRILFGELSGGRIVNPTSPRYNRQFTVNSLI